MHCTGSRGGYAASWSARIRSSTSLFGLRSELDLLALGLAIRKQVAASAPGEDHGAVAQLPGDGEGSDREAVIGRLDPLGGVGVPEFVQSDLFLLKSGALAATFAG